MKKIQKYKKAEMTSTQIVTIIFLLTGFVILMLVFPTVLNIGEVDRIVCHESVIFRGTLPDTFDLKNLPALKCKTKKICITDKMFGKGDCEAELGKEYVTYKISKDSDRRDDEINEFVANELADCWSMMGQGKLQIFTRDLLAKQRCSICSRIAFDSSLKQEINEVKGLGAYLIYNNLPNKDVTYWNFLTSGSSIEKTFDDKFSSNQKAIVFVEVNEGSWADWFGGGAGAIAGAKVGAFFGSVFGPAGSAVGGVAGFLGGAATGWYADSNGDKKSMEYRTGWNFLDYSGESLRKLECDSLESIP